MHCPIRFFGRDSADRSPFIAFSSGQSVSRDLARDQGGQPFTYDLFDALKLSEFGAWFAESSGPANCCWGMRLKKQSGDAAYLYQINDYTLNVC
jgi:hypothetical protein